jgi:hypothetical protein
MRLASTGAVAGDNDAVSSSASVTAAARFSALPAARAVLKASSPRASWSDVTTCA